MARRKLPKLCPIRRHKKIRDTCIHCGGCHDRSQHKSHGYGSYARTH